MSDRKAEVKKLFGLSADRATVPPLLFIALPRSRRNWLAMLCSAGDLCRARRDGL
ncbi:MAG TPA: hypothetical protein VI320_29150 [Terracidiphilus sp.]